MSVSTDHASLLFQTGRYREAENLLRQALSEDPEDSRAHALLAIAMVELEQPKEALAFAERAVQLEPEDPYGHYVMARVLRALERIDQAFEAIHTALKLNSQSALLFATLGDLHLKRSNWQAALEAANDGLVIDPDDESCHNVRGVALVQLGRRAEAAVVIGASLAANPENAFTHANRGWAYLNEGRTEQALMHYQEALRLDPNSAWARHGIVEALRARNPIYAVLLRYFLWMQRLSPRARWGVILGAVVGVRFLRIFQAAMPQLAPVATAVTIAYMVFAFFTWTARPLFDLLLRLDKQGRMALNKEQIRVSNWVGLCLLAAGALAVGAFFADLLPAAVMMAVLILPVTGSLHKRGNQRTVLLVYTLGLLGLALFSVYAGITGQRELNANISIYFILGIVLFTWIANLVGGER